MIFLHRDMETFWIEHARSNCLPKSAANGNWDGHHSTDTLKEPRLKRVGSIHLKEKMYEVCIIELMNPNEVINLDSILNIECSHSEKCEVRGLNVWNQAQKSLDSQRKPNAIAISIQWTGFCWCSHLQHIHLSAAKLHHSHTEDITPRIPNTSPVGDLYWETWTLKQGQLWIGALEPWEAIFLWAFDSHWDVRSLHVEFSSQLTWLLTQQLHWTIKTHSRKHFGTQRLMTYCPEYDSCRQPPRFWRDVARSATNSFPIAGEPAANWRQFIWRLGHTEWLALCLCSILSEAGWTANKQLTQLRSPSKYSGTNGNVSIPVSAPSHLGRPRNAVERPKSMRTTWGTWLRIIGTYRNRLRLLPHHPKLGRMTS